MTPHGGVILDAKISDNSQKIQGIFVAIYHQLEIAN